MMNNNGPTPALNFDSTTTAPLRIYTSQETSEPGAVMTTTSGVSMGDKTQTKTYNGVFLVDGLGRGVRIDHRMQQQPKSLEPSIHQYGLPVHSNPPSGSRSLLLSNESHVPSSAQSTSILSAIPNCSTSTNIRIEGNTSQPSLNGGQHNSFGAHETRFLHQQGQFYPVVIPVSPTSAVAGSHHQSLQSSTSVPKCKRNSVTLPVPSPPSLSMISTPYVVETSGLGDPSSSANVANLTPSAINMNACNSQAGLNSESGMMVTGMGSPITPNSNPPFYVHKSHHGHGNSGGEPRTLISTEAQTEDLTPSTLAPPPPMRNREQRKRERRERRRDRHHPHHSRHGPPRSVTGTNSDSAEETQININEQTSTTVTQTGPITSQQTQIRTHGEVGLPDLLHLPPPPYSTLPPQHCDGRRGGGVPLAHGHPSLTTTQIPLPQHTTVTGPPLCLPPPPPNCSVAMPVMAPPPNCLPSQSQPIRYQFSPPAQPITRASRRSLRTPRGIPYASEEEPKSCCGMSTSQAVSIRWFIIVIAGIGICCTVAGTALGAARSAGSQHLTLSLLMIGVGVVLLTVSAVAWRLTANESGTSSCRAMLGFGRNGSSRGDGGSEPNRVFVPRLPPTYGRPHHPYAAMMYPDFQYRPPPPSYQASMQEYRLRLLLLERSNPTMGHVVGNPAAMSIAHPPPAYRPYNTTHRPGVNSRHDVDLSRPPSYRSRTSGSGNGGDGSSVVSRDPSGNLNHNHRTLDPTSPIHSRDPSLLSYLSQDSAVSGGGNDHMSTPSHSSGVVTVMEVSVEMGLGLGYDGHDVTAEDEETKAFRSSMGDLDEEKRRSLMGDCEERSGTTTCGEKSKDGNLVRIVQTTDSSQVIGRDSVIVTVSGSNNNNRILWDHSHLQHHPSSTNQSHLMHHHLPSTDNNEVQILAHL